MKCTIVPRHWKPLLKGLPVIALGVAALGTAGSPLGIWSSHIERMSHFRWWWIALLLSLTAWFFRERRLALTVVAIALAIWAVVPLAPYWHSKSASTDDKGLTFLAWNILWENPAKELALPWLSQQDADVLLLTECTDDWRERLAPLEQKYPHRISSGRDGAEGMWLLSRHPLGDPEPDGLAAAKPWISTVMQSPQGPVRIIGMHPRTPRSGTRFDQRNEQYDHAATISSNAGIPVVLLGDLNCTPYSPWFRRLLKRGKLRDSALGFGLHSTWRRHGIGLPIDHILVSENCRVIQRRVHPDRMGSDHHPVIAKLLIAAP